ERLVGYRQALSLANYHFAPELVVNGDGKAEGGMQAMENLLKLPNPPTAVFCYNDMSALGAMRTIHLHGLVVPDDISVVGFDDLLITSYARPLLTTMRQPKEQMGRRAVETLLKLFSGLETQTHIKLKAELIVRESTAKAKA